MQLFHPCWGEVQWNYTFQLSERPWNLQFMGSLFCRNTVEQNGISGNMLHVVWDIPPFIYYLFFISYSPKKLKLPSVFCHFRTWGSAAAPSLWFSWHILLSLTWISLFQPSNHELWHCTKSWAGQALLTELCPGWALGWQGHVKSHTRKEWGLCHSVTAD